MCVEVNGFTTVCTDQIQSAVNKLLLRNRIQLETRTAYKVICYSTLLKATQPVWCLTRDLYCRTRQVCSCSTTDIVTTRTLILSAGCIHTTALIRRDSESIQ